MLATVYDGHLLLDISYQYALITAVGFGMATGGLVWAYIQRHKRPSTPPDAVSKWFFFAVVAGLILLLPDMAFAQTTFMQKWLTFTTGAVATTVATAAIILIGGLMVAQRHSAGAIFVTCAGIWIMLNAGNIEGWVGT